MMGNRSVGWGWWSVDTIIMIETTECTREHGEQWTHAVLRGRIKIKITNALF